jgi:hypothetical protein
MVVNMTILLEQPEEPEGLAAAAVQLKTVH